MQIKFVAGDGLERKFEITLPQDEIDTAIDRKLHALAAKVRLPGFRPGKVPFNLVKQRYATSTRVEVVEDSMRDAYLKGLEQYQLTPVGRPRFTVTSEVGDPEMLFNAVFEIYPEINLKPLDGLKVEKEVADVQDQDVNNMLEKIRHYHVTWIPVEDEKCSAANGDQVVVDFAAKMLENNDSLIEDEKDVKITIGERLLWEEFEKQLVGMKVNETKEFKLTLPDTHVDKNLAGKELQFRVLLKKIAHPKLPELDDKFAESMHEKGGMVALKKQVRNNLEQELKRTLEQRFENAIFDKVLTENAFSVPKALVENALIDEEASWEARLRSMTKNKKGHQLPAFPKEQYRPRAERQVSLGLLMAAIIKEHQLKVELNEVRDFIKASTKNYSSSEKQRDHMVERIMQNQQQLREYSSRLLGRKLVDFLKKKVQTVEKSVTYAEIMK